MRTKARQVLLIIFCSLATQTCLSQKNDSIKNSNNFSAVTSVTNNGISLIPSFSLGKPAAALLLSYGSRRFSIENDARFALDGKPWNFLLWGRYKLITQGKFRINTGANLSLNFRTVNNFINGGTYESIVVRRYIAADILSKYFITKNISLGSYYLYSKGVDQGTIKSTHFITLNASFSHIPIWKELYVMVSPQVYYLYQDGKKGYYFNSVFTLFKQHFPLSVSSIINKSIQTNIIGSKDFVWNLSAVYTLSRK